MSGPTDRSILRWQDNRLSPRKRRVVEEFPVRLRVNGEDLATLVASPHQLNFLVAGFFRLQGMAETLDDFLSLGICSDFGLAEVRLRHGVPGRLTPTLTSGCGTGIEFNLSVPKQVREPAKKNTFSPASIFALMRELAARAEQYRNHGGIHSAALGDGERLLLFAEDIGRHNTLDRIAGEALFKGVETRGRLLVTSGRISTEMVAKAARLGIVLIASRTSATDRAIELAERLGIALVGYVRGGALEVYSRPERLATGAAAQGAGRIDGVTGVILAGGESRRMGCNKSLLPIDGARFIDHIYSRLTALFDEVLIVTNTPELYADLPCRKVPDIYHAMGSLAGIHSGLCHARNDQVFVVACDMPFLSEEAIRALCRQRGEADVVIPRADEGFEPLHALYGKGCIGPIENLLDQGRRKIIGFFPAVKVREVSAEQLNGDAGRLRSLINVNTPEQYYSLRGQGEDGAGEENPYTQNAVCRKT